MTSEPCLPTDLLCPTPLPEAVEGGAFGFTETGPLCPNEIEVRELTQEHARQMIAILVDLTHVKWCDKFQLDPDTWKPSSTNRKEILAKRLPKEIAEFGWHYRSCLSAYELAFGQDASDKLDAAVRRFVGENFLRENPKIQGELF